MRATRDPGGRDSDEQHGHELFARAADGVLRGTPSTSTDQDLARELELVTALHRAGSAIGPTQLERDRMRRRLMAEFDAVVHEGSSPVLPLRRPGRVQRTHRAPHETRGRLVVAAAAALCLLMSLSGMSVMLARDALPGDALYTFKRSAESAELGLTFSEEGKALKHLEFASARVSEIELMAEEAAAKGTWAEGEERFLRALEDFERDLTAATRLLTAVAANGGESDILTALRGWVEQQEMRLRGIRAALPLPASTRLSSTLELLDRVVGRVSALDRQDACLVEPQGAHDELGLIPGSIACAKPAPPSGTAAAEPLPELEGVPSLGPTVDELVPPGLLSPPTPSAEPGRGSARDLLPSSPSDVLPTPESSGTHPKPSLPGREDGGSLLPLQLPLPLPNLPLLPLLPLLPIEQSHIG